MKRNSIRHKAQKVAVNSLWLGLHLEQGPQIRGRESTREFSGSHVITCLWFLTFIHCGMKFEACVHVVASSQCQPFLPLFRGSLLFKVHTKYMTIHKPPLCALPCSHSSPAPSSAHCAQPYLLSALCSSSSRKCHVLSIMVQLGCVSKLVLGVNTYQAIRIPPGPSPSLMHVIEDSSYSEQSIAPTTGLCGNLSYQRESNFKSLLKKMPLSIQAYG